MFPQPPTQGSPNDIGPAGLEQAVSQMFGTAPPEPNDPYEQLDPVVLLKRFEEAKKDGQDLRWVFERQWWRNLLYVAGRQWIYFDTKRNEWRDKRLKKWIPKPVTNKMREVQSAIRAMFSSIQLGVIVRPNGNDPKNIATANTCDQLQPLVHEEHDMDRQMRLSDFWVVNTGNVFLHPWWNPDEGEIVPVEHDECLTCGTRTDPQTLENPGQFACPSCGGMASRPVEVDRAPAGKGCTDVCSPFEIMLPSHAAEFRDCTWVIRIRWRPKSYYTINYPELAPRLTFEKQPSERSLHLFKALASQNDLSTTPFSWGGGQRAQSEGITEYEYWEQPSVQYPKGLFFRVVGEHNPRILEDPRQSSPGPIPVVSQTGETLWPWIHIAYEPFGGRLWSSGALDPLFQKQDQLNQVDSMIQLWAQRMANPIWMKPKGMGTTNFTGESGLVVEYDMIGASNLKPERLPGEPLTPGLFQLREQYLRDIEELAGTYDILKGQKPTGVEAFSALQLLVERSQSRFTNAFALRGEAYQAWFRVALELERMYGPTQRTLSLLGPNATWTFQTFQHADLLGDVMVVVEDGTNVPKTALGRRAAMEQANNMGFVNPQDPDQKAAFLSEMGLTNLMPGLDSAKKAALRQQDAFEQWVDQGLPGLSQGIDPMTGMPTIAGSPLTIQPWDDPSILLNELRKWANSDKMQSVLHDPRVGPIVTQILTQFHAQLAQMVAATMMPPPGLGPEPGHAPGNGQGMSRSNANSHPPRLATHGNSTMPSGPTSVQ